MLQRVPEHQYDFYILSDHGQTHCVGYQELTGGKAFERVLFDEFLNAERAGEPFVETTPRPGFTHGFRAYHIGEAGAPRARGESPRDRAPPYPRRAEAHERAGVRVVSAGPNAFFYVLDTTEPVLIESLERRFPGLADGISRSPGVGFVLARSNRGPVCFWRGKRYQLGRTEPGPFAGRDDCDVVLRDIADLMAMPSAGDLVIYGIDAPEGNVSYLPEPGAHAGPSPDELHTFIVHPPTVTLPPSIDHPIQLYDVFIRYQAHHAPSDGP